MTAWGGSDSNNGRNPCFFLEDSSQGQETHKACLPRRRLCSVEWGRRVVVYQHVIVQLRREKEALTALSARVPSTLNPMLQGVKLNLGRWAEHLAADTAPDFTFVLVHVLYEVALQLRRRLEHQRTQLALMGGAFLKHVVGDMQLNLVFRAERLLALDALVRLRRVEQWSGFGGCCSRGWAVGGHVGVQLSLGGKLLAALRAGVQRGLPVVARLAYVVGPAAGVELGDEVLLGVEGFEADTASVEAGSHLVVVLAMHLQLHHRRQSLAAHDALQHGTLRSRTQNHSSRQWTRKQHNAARPKTDKCLSSLSHFQAVDTKTTQHSSTKNR